MGRRGEYEKFALRILAGNADKNIRFDDLRNLLKQQGFLESIRGSHHIFRKQGIAEKINLRLNGHQAKPYQVRQVRFLLVKYGLLGAG